MTSEFSYLAEKILNAPTIKEPFDHIQIDNFLTDDHFEKLIADDCVHFRECKDNDDLMYRLRERRYEIVSFPGCKTDLKEYLYRLENDEWTTKVNLAMPHNGITWRGVGYDINGIPEYLNPLVSTDNNFMKIIYRKNIPIDSFGVTFRAAGSETKFVSDLIKYLNGDEFHSAMKKRFGLTEKTNILTAIQKNLTRYQISPHPDTTNKAMTYLMNINKTDEASELPMHTHLLKFKKEYEYVYDVWENGDHEREWVPWDWCETVKTHTQNNSIIMFSPTSRTLHAVNLDYSHLKFQRTQIYGNLMYRHRDPKPFRKNKYKGLIKP
tara:strand:- start:695 stop:1663 length:969 start_codon:yes stop_codon:yes gene_type:complete